MFRCRPLEKLNNRTYTDRWQTIEHFWFYTIKFFLFLQKSNSGDFYVFSMFVGEASADLSDGKKDEQGLQHSKDVQNRPHAELLPRWRFWLRIYITVFLSIGLYVPSVHNDADNIQKGMTTYFLRAWAFASPYLAPKSKKKCWWIFYRTHSNFHWKENDEITIKIAAG